MRKGGGRGRFGKGERRRSGQENEKEREINKREDREGKGASTILER